MPLPWFVVYTHLLSTSTTVKGRALTPIAGPVPLTQSRFRTRNSSTCRCSRTCLQIAEAECVAVVGAFGSGKSMIAALLQRLYEPPAGRITVGNTELRTIDIRDDMSVASQHQHLFDAMPA